MEQNELEGCAWIPLRLLAMHREKVQFSFGEFPAYIMKEYVIWGLTYRIIENLRCMID
jgi:hypothetical protein